MVTLDLYQTIAIGIITYIAGLVTPSIKDELWKRFVSADRAHLVIDTMPEQYYTVEQDVENRRLEYELEVLLKIYNKGKDFTSLVSCPRLQILCEDHEWIDASMLFPPGVPYHSIFHNPQIRIDGRQPPIEDHITYSFLSDNMPLVENDTIKGRLIITATHGQKEVRNITFKDFTEQANYAADLYLKEFEEARKRYPDLSDDDIYNIMAYGEKYLNYKEILAEGEK